ncbi:catalase [Asaia krungthepensis NRIC 0535]|uniref:Catalase-peroxidase n=2 Tax=Asaia krungthepensis TaxID=220990 RepID=A0ABQ0Q3Q0_9PROT|nr:catalase [Asaia krungthepensis NRIC 0535]
MRLLKFGMAALIATTTLTTMPSAARADGIENPNEFYWPTRLSLAPLRLHDAASNPYGPDFVYTRDFRKLDLEAVKADIRKTLTQSQPWWPADYGTYAPFFVRMAWHAAGTYRAMDGRGGEEGAEQRFEQLNSWPDNASLDKARRLLWPVKKKYGRNLSWGDLMVLTGNVALESMGFKTLGFAGGRADDWESELVYWGPGTQFMSSNVDSQIKKSSVEPGGHLPKPLASTTKGLIYVNPEGPNGVPDPAAAAQMIRLAFGRMAMNDEETVALIAGGHTFGKAHGAASATKCVGVAPAAAPVEQQGMGWANHCVQGKLKATDAITSGLEGAWSADPIHFTSQYLDNLLGHEWVKTKSPAGATQWVPKDAENIVPDASDPNKLHPLMMFTTDIALRTDPSYRAIITRWAAHPEQFADAFAHAWFKLTHRDLGPKSRYFGSEVPSADFLWQDPLPAAQGAMVNAADLRELKKAIAASGLTEREMIKTAWASAASFRDSDHRGGANGARIRLAPESDWAVNDPDELKTVLPKLEAVQQHFNGGSHHGRKISLADVIVLAGNVGVEQAAKKAGVALDLPFAPGRVDAGPEQTDKQSFALLELSADAFRNYYRAEPDEKSPTQMLVDRASNLSLSVPEMTVLLGGLRVLDINAGHSEQGVLTTSPGVLSNDFFVNLLDMSTRWEKSATQQGVYDGLDRDTGKKRWTASSVDLIFGANAELRAVVEVYASDDAKAKFVKDFASAWTKVMTLDRFDLRRN